MEGFICGFVSIEAGCGALENVSDVGNLAAGEFAGDYCLTSGVDGYGKRYGRECSIDCGRDSDMDKAQVSTA